MREVSNKTVMMLLIATLVISIGGSFISINVINERLGQTAAPPLTGMALAPNATISLSISTTSSIKFVSSTLDWDSGSVDTAGGSNNCSLSTIPEWGNSGCSAGGFSTLTNGLTIENDGGTNLSVELMSNVSAAQFIGGTEPMFLWNVTTNESNSCKNVSSDVPVYPNTTSDCSNGEPVPSCGTIFESISVNTYKVVCPRLEYNNNRDTLNVDLNVSIPANAPPGAKLAGITVRGTRSPLT